MEMTIDRRKALLIDDAYSAQLSIEFIVIMKNGGVEAHPIPGHTSGATQPLNIAVYCPFKQYINDELYRIMSARRATSSIATETPIKINLYDTCFVFRRACDSAFTRSNICS